MPKVNRKPPAEKAGVSVPQSVLLPAEWNRARVIKWLEGHGFIAKGLVAPDAPEEPGEEPPREPRKFWHATQYDKEHFIRFARQPLPKSGGVQYTLGVVRGQRKDGRLGSARVEFGLQIDGGGDQAAWIQREADGGLLLKRVPLFRECVNSYPTADGGTSREYKSWDAICDAAEYFEDAPVTYLHPENRMVDAQSFRQEARGHVRGPFEKDEKNRIIWGQAHIADGELTEMILAGEALGVSPGFFTEVFDGPGKAPDGSQFDRSQEFITPNHLAFGHTKDWARGGSQMRVALDGNGDAVILGAGEASDNHNKQELQLIKETFVMDGKPVTVETEKGGFEEAFKAYDAKRTKEVTDAHAERDKALGELAAEQKAHKETKAKLDASESPAERAKWAQARSELMQKAQLVSGNKEFTSDSGELGVMTEALKADGQDLSAIEGQGDGYRAGFITSEFNRLAKERASEDKAITDAYSSDPNRKPQAINLPPQGGGSVGIVVTDSMADHMIGQMGDWYHD